MGELLISTYSRILSHDRHPEDCLYLEFDYGPHCVALREDVGDQNTFSISVSGENTEPLERYFESTSSLSDNTIDEILGKAEADIQREINESEENHR
jgi:hypothetical protein